ncbi:xylulokinase [Sinobaca qinghaiensis]|uniref:Xylulokinase n=1 Tax=Sinobaca qinghaiensis TaxID=342944 RepID=A0A419V7G8_9BACL|nr:FGGY family carbohydrate kinase [Sinobaca qinghaiensis]RKD76056.1 xylulokinase [Sinobaca qinghaiensis]
MNYTAAFDLGTTSIKGILINKDGMIKYTEERNIHTYYPEKGHVEQDPEEWWEHFCSILKEWQKSDVAAADILALSFSGQMQDCIPIDMQGRPLRRAVLYSDARADSEADELSGLFSTAESNPFNGTMLPPKLLWLKRNEPDLFEKTACFLVGAKDYIIYRLTGNACTDPTTASTTGMFHLKKRSWMEKELTTCGLPEDKLPRLYAAHDLAGSVHKEAARECGLLSGLPVVCGSGDAGATTIGAGAAAAGQAYVYMGTTGWIASISPKLEHHREGIFQLLHPSQQAYIVIAPLLNAGSVLEWAAETWYGEEADPYQKMSEEAALVNGPFPDLLFLPYLQGERFPVQDMEASGIFTGIKKETGRKELVRAVYEGLAFHVLQALEQFSDGKNKETAVPLIGGGARNEEWCSVLADVTNESWTIPADMDLLPCLGAAAPAFIYLGWSDDYDAYTAHVLARHEKQRHNAGDSKKYEALYTKYKMLYPLSAHM